MAQTAGSEWMMLKDHDERLLLAYLDGEAGFVGRLRARLLLRRPEARAYVQSMQRVGTETRAWAEGRVVPEVSLWDRVATRLDQEERAALFLGARERSAAPVRLVWSERLAWAVPSAAVAALATVFVIGTEFRVPGGFHSMAGTVRQEREQLATIEPAVLGLDAPVQPVSLRSAPAARPQTYLPAPVEVRWMRSNGRVQLMQDPENRSAIIWIRTKPNQRRRGSPDPLLSTNRVPEAIPVSTRGVGGR